MTTDLDQRRRRALVPLLAAAALGSGCVSMTPGGWPPGTPIGVARQGWIGPTAEHVLPGGGTRLEFSQGRFGKETYMHDFDASGALVSSNQVLTPASFATIVPGMPRADVRMRLGRPSEVFSVPWQKLQVWNYRFFEGDCVWFQVSFSDATQRVTETGTGQDPACDGPNDRVGSI